MRQYAVRAFIPDIQQIANMESDLLQEDMIVRYLLGDLPEEEQTRLEDIMLARNPSDPFADRPALGVELKKALRQSE